MKAGTILMAGKTCQICGAPSGMYPLCKDHLQMKNDGKVVKNDDGKWVLVEEKVVDNSKCVICGESSYGKPLCIDCYKESIERKDEFDRNQLKKKLRLIEIKNLMNSKITTLI